MTDLSHKQKFRLIERNCERKRAASDGDSTISPRKMAARKCGFSPALASYVANGRPIKNPTKLAHFENVFRTEVAAEVGSVDYQKLWADVRAVVDGTRAEPLFSAYLVPAAHGQWAAIALDTNRSDAERLLAGRMAEFILYHYTHNRKTGFANKYVVEVDPTAAQERGHRVIACLARILASNPTPPPGLFDHGMLAAQELGYQIFRRRLFADHTGWQAKVLTGDADRAQHFADAYNAGMATDLMWLHEELEHSDVGHPCNAFVLATHAGDWPRVGEYGVALLRAFPNLLTEEVGNTSALLDDRPVWPGVAAMMTHRWLDIPPKLRRVSTDPDTKHITALRRIRQMMAGVKVGDPYLSVLKMGE